MKVVQVISGSTYLRFQPEDVLPPNGVAAAEISTRLASEFKFQSQPVIQSHAILMTPAIQFSAGQFSHEGKEIGVNVLGLGPDAIGAACASTALSDAVIAKVTNMLDRSFGYRFSSASRNTQTDHNSVIVAKFDRDISSIFEGAKKLENAFEKHRPSTAVMKQRFQLFSLALGRDFGLTNVQNQIDGAAIGIERRNGIAFEENCFWCTAPYPSDAHVAALEELERTA
jgi:hypothetical protein